MSKKIKVPLKGVKIKDSSNDVEIDDIELPDVEFKHGEVIKKSVIGKNKKDKAKTYSLEVEFECDKGYITYGAKNLKVTKGTDVAATETTWSTVENVGKLYVPGYN